MMKFLSSVGARNRLIVHCRENGGVASFVRLHGLSLDHVKAIVKGEIEMSDAVAVAIGLQPRKVFMDAVSGAKRAQPADRTAEAWGRTRTIPHLGFIS